MDFPTRCRILPASGKLLVSTDLHGNLGDFESLEALFLSARRRGEDVHWALLGNLIHGPNPVDAQLEPHLYGYVDESAELAVRADALIRQHEGRVHLVLGNHNHGHIGGVRTAKFHDDEVEFLEQQLTRAERAAMHHLFAGAALILAAPCGALLSHGSPGDEVRSLAQLEGPLTAPAPGDDVGRQRWRAIQSVLWSYGQSRQSTEALLDRLSPEVGFPLRFVVHGHDRDEQGLLIEADNQLQPVLFGALRMQKRYLWLDLAVRYGSLRDLREGREIRRLYGEDP